MNNKPRDYWIPDRKLNTLAYVVEPPSDVVQKNGKYVHVIEYEAYEEMREELQQTYDKKCESNNGIPPLCENWQTIAMQTAKEADTLRAQNKNFRETLEKIKYNKCPNMDETNSRYCAELSCLLAAEALQSSVQGKGE